MALFHYIPFYIAYLGPTPETRHWFMWLWQLFPLWVSLAQYVGKATIIPYIFKEEMLTSRKYMLGTTYVTIGTLVTMSTANWWNMLLSAPYPIKEIMLPRQLQNVSLISVMRGLLAWDNVFCFGTAYLWLAYLLNDLARLRTVRKIKVLGFSILGTLVLGPGATSSLIWLYRERLLWDYKRIKSTSKRTD